MLNRLPAGIGFASAINEGNFELGSAFVYDLGLVSRRKVGSHPNLYKRKATWKDKRPKHGSQPLELPSNLQFSDSCFEQ